MWKQYSCSCEFILMLITFTYKFIIIMLICYVTIKLLQKICLLMSLIVVYCSCSGHILNDFTWTHCGSGRFNTAWFIYTLLLIDIFDKQTRENVSQTLLHAVAHRFQEKQNVAKRWACELEPGVLVELELTTECHLKFFLFAILI